MFRDKGSLSGSRSEPLHECIDPLENGFTEGFDVKAICQGIGSKE